MISQSKQGVVYIATSERFRQRAFTSVESLKAQMPDVSVTLFTDKSLGHPAFDNVILIPAPNYNDHTDKVIYIPQSPYEYTLFIDADTYITDDLSELFLLLEHFDLAVAHDTFRINVADYEKLKHYLHQIPVSFPMLNSGVILFKKSERLDRFFAAWMQIHQRNLTITRDGGDQPAFREALYYSDLRFTVLPSEYNCRFIHPLFLNQPAKVLHGPHHDLAALASEVNRVKNNRVFIPGIGTIAEKMPPVYVGKWWFVELGYSLKKRIDRTIQRRLKRYIGSKANTD
jgi:hypothetical protein